MTNKTEMVSVPRELLERLAAYAPEGICGPTALQGFAFEAKRILAAPTEDVRTVVDEPVACYVASDDLEAIRNGSKMWATAWASDSAMNPSRSFSEPLYRHPQRPMVFPERKQIPDLMMASWHEAKGWNACLDRIAELNK